MSEDFLDRLLPVKPLSKIQYDGIGLFHLEYEMTMDHYYRQFRSESSFRDEYEIVSINPQRSRISYKIKSKLK